MATFNFGHHVTAHAEHIGDVLLSEPELVSQFCKRVLHQHE